VKNLVRSLGRKVGSPLIDELINEVNRSYYTASKKAILDYILKDEDEKRRIGVTQTYTAVPEWGHGNKHILICEMNK
jgi:hypothetical protein